MPPKRPGSQKILGTDNHLTATLAIQGWHRTLLCGWGLLPDALGREGTVVLDTYLHTP